jgi:hypothetical protein
VIFDPGDEIAKGLKEFAKQQSISAASFKAIGALSSVNLGSFSWETKKYEPSVQLSEQVELLSLIGDVALQDEEPAVHAHAIVGRKDGKAYGGYLLSASVRPTCEVVSTESPSSLHKKIDPEAAFRSFGCEHLLPRRQCALINVLERIGWHKIHRASLRRRDLKGNEPNAPRP